MRGSPEWRRQVQVWGGDVGLGSGERRSTPPCLLLKYNGDSLNVTAMRKREAAEPKRAPQPFFKYIQPAKPHIRSMMELEPTARYSARLPAHPNKENHHASLNHDLEPDTAKPNSLKKFLSMFGPPPRTGRTERSNSQKQVFTCNIKNVNLSVNSKDGREKTAEKEREKEKGMKGLLVLKNNKVESTELAQLKKQQEEAAQRETKLQRQIQQLQSELQATAEQRRIFEEKWTVRERQLERKIEHLERNAGRQRCREQQLIIQSLKKVINEQLRKIIELQKCKVQREEIQKLQERINLNITRPAPRKHPTISCSFEDSELSEEAPGLPIQEATEEEEQSFREEPSFREGDSILEEVDRYLSEWRRR